MLGALLAEIGHLRASKSDDLTLANIWVPLPGKKREGHVFYLFREGMAHNTRVITRLELIADKRGNLMLMKVSTVDTCTGDPCSSCLIVTKIPSGLMGCDCKDDDKKHICNHTVSTPRDRELLDF